MSFAPPVQMKTGGVDGRNLATTQEGIPLPWFCGVRRLKANWITQATNRRTRDGNRREGEHWFCQITAAFGYGPAAGIQAMYYNGKYRDYGFEGEIPINREDYPGYYTMSPNEFGLNGDKQQWEGAIGRIHWGLDPAPVDPQNPAASYPLLFGDDNQNPRYWRVILAEWNQLFLGINQPARMPNIEATFARHAQIPAGWSMATDCAYWIQPTTGIKIWNKGVPPVAALLEILTDQHTGFGRDPDSLDQSTWEGIASELSGEKWRINPLIDQPMTEGAVIEEFLKYFDGYTYYRNGKLALGRRPDEVTILVPEDYTELTSHDMTRPPGLKTTRPDETINEVAVTWLDPTDLQFKEVTKVYDAPTNREARGEPLREEIDLSWKSDEPPVDSYARKFLGHGAAVRQVGPIWVRENRCLTPLGQPLQVGDVIFLDQSVPQLDHAYRITGRKRTDYGEIQLDLETERGQYPLAYVAPSDPVPNAELPEVDGIGVVKWLELPWELTGVSNHLTIFPILKRASGTVAGCTVWFKDSEDAFHAVADFGPPNFGSSGARVAADSLDEEVIREWTVSGAGTAAANGLYTKGDDINGRPAWYGPDGHKIAYVDAQSPWAIHDASDDTLYINDSETFASDWDVDAGAGPDPTVEPDLWTLRATLDDTEEIVQTQTKGESEDNTLLMCQGSEIYSVELVLWDDIAGNYKIHARRGRLGSLREDHGAGGGLAFIRRDSIAYLGHEFIQYGATITYKLQPRNWAQALKLEDATEQQFTVSDESLWLPTVSFNSPTILNSVIQGDLQIGEDIPLDFNVTAPRGRNEDVSIAGYRFGASQSADAVQDAVRQWVRPTQTNFKATVEVPILEWYAISVFATNRYGTATETIWAYAGPVVHAQNLAATGYAYGIDLTWDNDDLPDFMSVGVFDNADGSLALPWIKLEGDAITNLSYWIKLSKAGNYAVWIQSYRVVNGKEYTPENMWGDTDVPVGVYTAIDEPILAFPTSYAVELTWDENDSMISVGSDGFVGYEWYFNDATDQKHKGRTEVGEGVHGWRTERAGAITLNVWLEDKDGNRGNITQLTGTVTALAEPTILSVSKPSPYTLRVFYDPATVEDNVHVWGWPNYPDGFKERVWADYVTKAAVPNNYIDFPCIRDSEYRLSLYTSKPRDDGFVKWSPDPSTSGVAYATPDTYAAVQQNGANPVVSVPNPYEFILYWDGSQYPNTPEQFYVVYRWKPAAGGNETWEYNYQLAEHGQMNQPVQFSGGIHIEYWIEDSKSRKGQVVSDTGKTITSYAGITDFLFDFSGAYNFSFTWDENADEAEVGSDGFVVYEWYFNAKPNEKFLDKAAVGEGVAGTATIEKGAITLNVWLEDRDGKTGAINQYTGTVAALPEAKINEITKPDPYTLRVFYDPTTVYNYVHLWGWPNYTNGFKEAKWADYVTPQAAPNNYIDFPCIRDAEYRLSLYSTKEKENGLVQWTTDPTTILDPGPPLVKGGVAYKTPDAYAAPSQLGGAAILTVPNPHEFILYWDGSDWPSTKGQMYLVYRWKPASGGSGDWKYNYQLANYNQMNQPVDFSGGIHVEWWIEDQESRKGTVTQDTSKTILGWAAMTNFSVDAQGASWDAQTDAEIIEVWADNGDGSWNESYRCDGLKTGAALTLIDFGGLASTETQFFKVRYMKKGLWSEFSSTDSYTYP